MPIEVIAFDADDTLWINEPYFREAEVKFCELLSGYMPPNQAERELFAVEMQNLPLYGYGIKSFVLCLVETALKITDYQIPPRIIEEILGYGKEMLEKPVILLEGVEEVLSTLYGRFRLVVATKGDLLDQERKLRKSGLEKYFHHIEIMSDKKEADYSKLIRHLDIRPEAFLMVGNSLKSDILPVLGVGGHAVHVPFDITWAHEQIDHAVEHANFSQMATIREILAFV
ncbi:HAD family hydrolase [Siphonobacter aquaeclarae]|jgi:putative hydrolase of the HAD superfamily|uniref:Putative hydrolase of the HAD superfamily n=1 Tax=Siphonobacter aquaeclarae TaxID=563176 RepID=A0A1G9HLJ0_9BACT|nr:HAD family hydrolase [Siphonobacter aquaeclarae]MBO9637866.1 HAD family hydrolase [Siphonobacter aquaeclarae]SDL13831.1 putative hydrolase of the HAD superfamily [Siphonobacter aquaeclarae]